MYLKIQFTSICFPDQPQKQLNNEEIFRLFGLFVSLHENQFSITLPRNRLENTSADKSLCSVANIFIASHNQRALCCKVNDFQHELTSCVHFKRAITGNDYLKSSGNKVIVPSKSISLPFKSFRVHFNASSESLWTIAHTSKTIM